MSTPEMKEQLDVVQKASAKVEGKNYVPHKATLEPKQDLPDLDKAFDDQKISKVESKEILTKSLEFEKDTFKIDSTGWKEKKRTVYGELRMKVKVNATGDVVEYLEGVAKGEQIFITYDAFIREVMKAKNCSKEEVEKKYMMTVYEFHEKMKDKPKNSPEYKKFFNEEVKGHLAGDWNPYNKRFNYVGERSGVWLVGGNNAEFGQDGSSSGSNNSSFGFSGRLLKN